MTSIHYTAHYNWAWVVSSGLDQLKRSLNLNDVVLHDKFRDLPSCKASNGRPKPTYSLFRLDIINEDSENIGMVRTRSDIFGFLDPKDSLARICQLADATCFMPNTLLIPWNWTKEGTCTTKDEISVSIQKALSTGPKLLKAPLGSGGFGLYFVYSLEG